jgi:hypothetical protein
VVRFGRLPGNFIRIQITLLGLMSPARRCDGVRTPVSKFLNAVR